LDPLAVRSRRASFARHFTIRHEYHRAASNVQANGEHYCVGNCIRNSKSRELTSHRSSTTLCKVEVPGRGLLTLRFALSAIAAIMKRNPRVVTSGPLRRVGSIAFADIAPTGRRHYAKACILERNEAADALSAHGLPTGPNRSTNGGDRRQAATK